MSFSDPDKWVELYGDYLYRFAMSRLSDPGASEDAVQETFLAAIKGIDNYDSKKVDFKYWLRGILRNKTVDYIRKRVREMPAGELSDYDEEQNSLQKFAGIPHRDVESFKFSPQTQYDKKEFWQIFNKCLLGLKSPMKEIYILKEVESEKSEDICKEFNISSNNLWVIVHRSRSALKKCLNSSWMNQ